MSKQRRSGKGAKVHRSKANTSTPFMSGPEDKNLPTTKTEAGEPTPTPENIAKQGQGKGFPTVEFAKKNPK